MTNLWLLMAAAECTTQWVRGGMTTEDYCPSKTTEAAIVPLSQRLLAPSSSAGFRADPRMTPLILQAHRELLHDSHFNSGNAGNRVDESGLGRACERRG